MVYSSDLVKTVKSKASTQLSHEEQSTNSRQFISALLSYLHSEINYQVTVVAS